MSVLFPNQNMVAGENPPKNTVKFANSIFKIEVSIIFC